MKKKGFTLAEVLITLGIIGVVAAITLPTLMQNGAKQQLGAKLAKFATNLEKITRAAAVEETITREDVWKLLNEEMLFDGQGLGDYKDNSADSDPQHTATSQRVTLRDGTQFHIGAWSGSSYGDDNKYGSSVAQIVFRPKIAGLSGGPQKFVFDVTSKGYVFPDKASSQKPHMCTREIYKNKYKAANIYGIKQECICTDKSSDSGCDD